MDAATHAILSAAGTLLAAGVSRWWQNWQMRQRVAPTTTYTVRVVS